MKIHLIANKQSFPGKLVCGRSVCVHVFCELYNEPFTLLSDYEQGCSGNKEIVLIIHHICISYLTLNKCSYI